MLRLRSGRGIWAKKTGDPKSLVQSEVRCFNLLSERVEAKHSYRKIAELKVRAAILSHSMASSKANCDGHVINPAGFGVLRSAHTCNKANAEGHCAATLPPHGGHRRITTPACVLTIISLETS